MEWPEVAIVVPCFNEELRLPAPRLLDYARDHPPVHFCLVNDGSTDGTAAILRQTAQALPERIHAMDLRQNLGKGEAVRAGMHWLFAHGHAAWVGYWDADLATPLEELDRFVRIAVDHGAARFLCGSRVRLMGTHIERSPHRHYLGRVFATAASQVLGLPIYDTQCGAKLIDCGLARAVFDKPFLSRWLFDVELLARTVDLLGPEETHRAVLEVPLATWRDEGHSKVKLRHFLRAPWDLLRIAHQYRPGPKAARNVPTPPDGDP